MESKLPAMNVEPSKDQKQKILENYKIWENLTFEEEEKPIGMEVELFEIYVKLSNYQKQEIRNAFINGEKIRLKLSKDSLTGNVRDTLLVPTSFFEEMDNEDGLDAVVGEETEKKMREEFESHKHEIQKSFEMCKDEIEKSLEMLYEIKRDIDFEIYQSESEKRFNLDRIYREIQNYEIYKKIYREQINQDMWEYYGLFFYPAIDSSMKNERIEFNLDYSLLNDSAKDFVKDNIKKLFQ